ncbi:MAG: hypothetical protein K6T78_02445 [Alicyclobacillus sp.]|nr:hypothetical protein [Alicyclobacillus sp.]
MQTWSAQARAFAKRAAAVILFTVLLIGSGGAVLSAIAAGVTALGNIQVGTPAVPALASGSDGGGTNGLAPATAAGSTPADQGVGTSGTGLYTTSSSALPEIPVETTPSVVDRLNQQLSHMQSPVMAHLDAGGVALGDEVQNAFGQFLSGLLDTLFVERAPSQTVQSQVTTAGQGPWN